MRTNRIRMFLLSSVAALAVSGGTATASDYGSGSFRQVELSANIPGHQGGGVWLWIELNADGYGNYSGSDCGHAGQGASSDKGDVSWHYTDSTDTSIEIDGVQLNGFGAFSTTITIPAAVGHYTGTVGSYLTLPPFIPTFIGFSQLQVAP